MFTVPLVFELSAFLLGLLFGSFLNVCISRLPAHQSILKPRSHCPHCLATIRWYDNIPLLNWLLLRAHCRDCKQPIPWRYPAVEFSVGILFAVALLPALGAASMGIMASTALIDILLWKSLTFLILGFLLIGLLVMDWQTHTLPDAFTLTGTLLGFLLTCVRAAYLAPHEYDLLLHGRNPLTSVGGNVDPGNIILTGSEHLVLGRLLAIAAMAGLLLFLRFAYQTLRHRDGLGLGDIKLAAMLAAFLGFWPAVLAVFLGFILGSLYALTLIARRKATATTHLPLGTFLAIGGLLAALLGTPLIAWYTSLL